MDHLRAIDMMSVLLYLGESGLGLGRTLSRRRRCSILLPTSTFAHDVVARDATVWICSIQQHRAIIAAATTKIMLFFCQDGQLYIILKSVNGEYRHELKL
jgi:hypothetical protein